MSFEEGFSLLFLRKNIVLTSANERSDQLVPKSTPLCVGPTVSNGPKSVLKADWLINFSWRGRENFFYSRTGVEKHNYSRPQIRPPRI